MSNRTIDILTWAGFYAGMFGFGLGVWFSEHDATAGVALMVGGGALIAAGAVLLWLRSRRS